MSQSSIRTIKFEQVPCLRCRGEESRNILTGEDYLYGIPGLFHVAQCMNCGLWYQNPRPTEASLPILYPNTYGPHAPALDIGSGGDASTQKQVLRVVNRVRRHLEPFNPLQRLARKTALWPKLLAQGSLLEIGCANGARLAQLRDQGWQHLCGIELLHAAAGRARARGFHVESGMAELALDAFPDHSFDAIIASMVIEHLCDPFLVVKKIQDKLRPGGQFLFSTVVRDSFDAWLYGRYWTGFDFPRHMVHLNFKDIDAMLEVGFEKVRFVYQVAPIDFVRSSGWRKKHNEGSLLDDIFIFLEESLPARIFNLALACIGRTARVSIYCQSKTTLTVARSPDF